MIVYLWAVDGPCSRMLGVSGQFDRACAAAGACLTAAAVSSARVEAAVLAVSVLTLQTGYARTGTAWEARAARGGAVCWEPVPAAAIIQGRKL